MPPEQLQRIQMKAVSFTNELYDEEAAKRARGATHASSTMR